MTITCVETLKRVIDCKASHYSRFLRETRVIAGHMAVRGTAQAVSGAL